MHDIIISYLDSFPREIATLILAALPVTELRLALPVAMHVWLLLPLQAYFWAVIGNLIPLLPLFFGLEWVRKIVEKYSPWLTKGIDKIVKRAHDKVNHSYEKHGAIALFLFTALPLPLTGLYTATLAAVALKVPFKYAGPAIIIGVLTAGIIVTTLSSTAELYF